MIVISRQIMLIILKKSKEENFFKKYVNFKVMVENKKIIFKYSPTTPHDFDDMLSSLPANYNTLEKLTNISNLTSLHKLKPFKTSVGEWWILCVSGKDLAVQEIESLSPLFNFNIYAKNLNRRSGKFSLQFKTEYEMWSFYLNPQAKMFQKIQLMII